MRTLRTLLLMALAALLATASAQGLPRDVRLNILKAVVQIYPWDTAAEDFAPWSGSGTIISPSGYILTNYHVAGDLARRTHHEWHGILLTDPDFTDQPPDFMFWARFIAGDPTHDLAILKIEEWYDEEPVGDMTFPHVTVGDSNSLLPGDVITIVGYPSISGSTVTFTAGLMSGWVGEDFESGGKQWIKTDAKISHGNSGGGAFDPDGHLIGVPTAGRTVKYDELDIEDQAYVRPIGLAWALIGPHVADVARAPLAGGPGRTGQPQTNTTQGNVPTTPTTPTAPLASGFGPCDLCTVGALNLGASASNAIGGMAGSTNYHTYSVTVPQGTTYLTIELTSDGDVDIAVKFGSEIASWDDGGDWDYLDITEAAGARYDIPNPQAGIWYIDIIYFYQSGSTNYTLSVR